MGVQVSREARDQDRVVEAQRERKPGTVKDGEEQRGAEFSRGRGSP